MRKTKKYPSSIQASGNVSFTCPSCGNKTLYCVDHDIERVADVDYHDTFVCDECGYECLSEPKYSGGIRFVKPVDSSLDVSDYEELNTGISDGGKNYRLYRKLVDGRGKWAAQETKSGDPVGDPFEITYDQARGYEGINDAGRLGREVGKKLFSRKGSSIKSASYIDYMTKNIRLTNDYFYDHMSSLEDDEIKIFRDLGWVKGEDQGDGYVEIPAGTEFRYQGNKGRFMMFKILGTPYIIDFNDIDGRFGLEFDEYFEVASSVECASKDDKKVDRRLARTSTRYKGYRISLDNDHECYNIYDRHGELEDHGFKSTKDAIAHIDEVLSIESSTKISASGNWVEKEYGIRQSENEEDWIDVDEWSRKRGIPFGPDLNDDDWERTHNTYLYEVGGDDAVRRYGSPDYGYLYDVKGASSVEDLDPDDYVYGEEIEDDEVDLDTPEQEFTSEKTSINVSKLPAVFKMVTFQPGTINLDYGGGKFDNAAEYLKDQDVTNLVYDPYNRTTEHNKDVIRTVRKNGGADTATCSNVLNVIKEPNVRKSVLENIKKLLKPSGTVYITVYEGSGKGNEGPTKSGYQMNRKTEGYLDEIREVFPDAKRRGKLIVAHPSGSVEGAEDLSYDALRSDDNIYDVWSIYNKDGEWVNEDKLETFDNYDEAVSYAKEQSAYGPCHIVKIGPDGQEIVWSTEEDEMVVSYDVVGSETIEGRLVDAPQSVIDELLDILEKYGFVLDPAFDENPGKTWMGNLHLQVINENSSANDNQSLRRYVTREMIDEIDELGDRTDCPITWNFGPNKQGQVTGGLDVHEQYVEDEGIEGSQDIDLRSAVYDFLDEIGGYADYNQKIEEVSEEFGMSPDAAEGLVCDWIHNHDAEWSDTADQEDIEGSQEINLPGYAVSYASGYAGWGVNHIAVKYFRTEKEQKEFAQKLKDQNVRDIKTYKQDNFYHTLPDKQDVEEVKGADYGGAFDIDSDQFFTKEEIVEFGNAVAERFSDEVGSTFILSDVYMDTPKVLHLEVTDHDVDYCADVVIDMRGIRKPSDIYKYETEAVVQLEDDYRDYHGLDIDASTDVDYASDANFDDSTKYELIEYIPDSGENGMSGDEFSVLDSGLFSSLEEAADYWSDMLQDENVFIRYEKSYEDLEPVDSARYDVPEPSLDPPEEREPQEDSFKATIQIDLDDVVVVNGDDIDFEESDPDFALSPDGNDEWTVGEASDTDKIVELEGVDDIVLDDKDAILENVMDLILPQIPEEDGSYRVRGTVKLIYEVDVTDYLDEDGEEPVSGVADYSSNFKFRESSFDNVKVTSVDK